MIDEDKIRWWRGCLCGSVGGNMEEASMGGGSDVRDFREVFCVVSCVFSL